MATLLLRWILGQNRQNGAINPDNRPTMHKRNHQVAKQEWPVYDEQPGGCTMAVEIMDRIEKRVLLDAPRARVWKALTDSAEFGQWFGVRFNQPFRAGAVMRGVVTPTTVDAEIARMQTPYEGHVFEITIDRIEPERLFAFRWHPYEVNLDTDYSQEPTTLVTFTLEETPGGVLLTVVESGFDRIPLARRAKAFTENEGGWTAQMTLIQKYLATVS
jgi:uncharacterized protein YndB with AHSA1/START domain